jgi:hypothetical protein
LIMVAWGVLHFNISNQSIVEFFLAHCYQFNIWDCYRWGLFLNVFKPNEMSFGKTLNFLLGVDKWKLWFVSTTATIWNHRNVICKTIKWTNKSNWKLSFFCPLQSWKFEFRLN